MTDESRKLDRLKTMRRWRRRICITFMPLGLALMLLVQFATDGAVLLVWPLLLVYTLAAVIALHQLDACPWCRQSFHTPRGDNSGGLNRKALWRERCANCEQPKSGPRD